MTTVYENNAFAWGLKASLLKNYGKTFMLMDGNPKANGAYSLRFWWVEGLKNKIAYRHANMSNVLMCDGHVTAIHQSNEPDIAHAYATHPLRALYQYWLYE